IGWSPDRLVREMSRAAERVPVLGPLTHAELQAMVDRVVDPDGPLARAKVFHRRDIVVAVAPLLFGRPAGEWRDVVDAVLARPETIPLVRTPQSRGRMWSLASVIAMESAIAETVARGTVSHDAPAVAREAVTHAISLTERRLGHPLTRGQHDAVQGICHGGE